MTPNKCFFQKKAQEYFPLIQYDLWRKKRDIGDSLRQILHWDRWLGPPSAGILDSKLAVTVTLTAVTVTVTVT